MAETVASILKKKGGAIWSVEPTATVYEAIAMMAEKSVGAQGIARTRFRRFSARNGYQRILTRQPSCIGIGSHVASVTHVMHEQQRCFNGRKIEATETQLFGAPAGLAE